jgi:hypothetical protein
MPEVIAAVIEERRRKKRKRRLEVWSFPMALHFTVNSRDVCMNMPWFEDFWSFGFREQVISSDAANRSSDSSEWGFPCAEVTKAVQLAARYDDQFWQNIFQTFLKGHSRDTLCLGTDISCWIWLVGFCSLNISAAFTLSPPAIGLKACQAGWAGTSAAQLSDLLRNYSVGQWHFTGWIVFLNHVKVLLGCLYVSYKHILASWSINTTFHRFSL